MHSCNYTCACSRAPMGSQYPERNVAKTNNTFTYINRWWHLWVHNVLHETIQKQSKHTLIWCTQHDHFHRWRTLVRSGCGGSIIKVVVSLRFLVIFWGILWQILVVLPWILLVGFHIVGHCGAKILHRITTMPPASQILQTVSFNFPLVCSAFPWQA